MLNINLHTVTPSYTICTVFMPHLAGDKCRFALPSTASRQKYVAYGTDYGDECQHVLWQDTQMVQKRLYSVIRIT